MLSSSDMSWHHPVSSDRQPDPLQLDPYHHHHPHPPPPQNQPHPPHPQSSSSSASSSSHHHSATDNNPSWDIFASPVDFETVHVNPNVVPAQQQQQQQPPVMPSPMREPSYDLFNAAPNTFGPTSRFRSDSSASSSYAPPSASPTTYGGEYLYNPNGPSVSSPPSAVSTRPSSAGFYQNAQPGGTISPDAVGPPSFAELMIDRTASSGPPSATGFSPFNGYDHQQQQQQQRFQMAPYDLASPPQQYIGAGQSQSQQRPGLRHNAQSLPAGYSTPFSGAFDPSATLAASAPLVKREDVPFTTFGGQYQPDGTDLQSFIRPYLERYINSPNRSTAGECSIIVMSSKVAQKSYGTEKRFLCPPPTAVMIGNHWWYENRRGDAIVPPKAVISISGEPSPLESLTEWSTPLGKNFDPADPPAPPTTTYMGRCIGKQLFITDYDDRKKKVEALVRIVKPADEQEAEPEKLIGVFQSKPIKVISKPSKKRQSAKNLELCINHGSTVSLFHRLRSQTVSTKYLCVSGSAAAYKGSDGQPLPGVDRSRQTAPPSFIAKTASWDSFIIYIVDVNKATGPDTVPPPPPHPDYPSPPPNAIPYNTNGAHMYTPIYYNQTVVLQCLISGVVSPVLIIRKVDHGTVVTGGGMQEGVKGVPSHYCAPGEVCGDPVSQLHKIALEVYEPSKQGAPNMDPSSPGQSGSFLSCMGERVNTYRPSEDRQWNGQQQADSSSNSGHSPSLPNSPIASPTIGAPDYFSGNGAPSSTGSTPGMDYSNDGGRVRPSRQQKRGSLSNPPTKATSKGRRRVNSASTSRANSGNGSTDSPVSSGALWSVDIGETAVWTVVGTDQIRYDFYIPPAIFGSGYAPSPTALASPPSNLANQIAPTPIVVKYLPPERAGELPKSANNSRGSKADHHGATNGKMLTIYGENFNKADGLSVWFGSEPSPHTEVRCSEVINCLPPASTQLAAYQRPIVLVRGDGVVFPTKVMYP